MTIFELGALGEFVSAVVVIFTLLYLGLQIRLNRLSIAADSYERILTGYATINNVIASDPSLADLVMKGMTEKLEGSEMNRFSWVLNSWMNLWLNIYTMYKRKAITQREFCFYATEAVLILESPSGKAHLKYNPRLRPIAKIYENYVMSESQRLEFESDARPFFGR